MAVDSHQKRMSATYIIDPTALGIVVTDGTTAVDRDERQSAARAYEGILATLILGGGSDGLLMGIY